MKIIIIIFENYFKKPSFVKTKVFGISLSVPNLAIVLEYMRRGSLYSVLRQARNDPVCFNLFMSIVFFIFVLIHSLLLW